MTMSTLNPGAGFNRTLSTESSRSPERTVWLALLLFIALWAMAVVTFGLPGLYLPALALVPVVWVLLLMISWG